MIENLNIKEIHLRKSLALMNEEIGFDPLIKLNLRHLYIWYNLNYTEDYEIEKL